MLISVKLTRQENADYFKCKVGDTVQVEFEDYVAAVTASELASGGLEGCKAQAVAARTFAVGRGVLKGKAISDASSTAQAYRANRNDETRYPDAVHGAIETAGLILTYNGSPISAVYSACNGGRTVSAKEKWGSARPYLIAQDDPWDAATGRPKSGHGVGMSQVGARWAAQNLGKTFEEILAFYYPGTKLEKAVSPLVILNEKAQRVIELAESQLGYPYVFGALGEDCTPSLRGRRQSSAHPTIKSKCQVLSGRASTCDGCQWKGARMFDCRGFTYWVLKQVGITISTVGATTQWNRAQDWLVRGELADMPNCVCCLFRRVGSKMEHTGFHVGNGKVIHCSVNVQTGTTARDWTHYAVPLGLYTKEELGVAGKVVTKVTLRNGSSGEAVKALQEMLNKLGYNAGKADGKFGANTEAAVRRFQAANNLTVDGLAGTKTQELLAVLSATQENEPQEPSVPSDDKLSTNYNEALNEAQKSLTNAVSSINDAIKYLEKLKEGVPNG